jgi:hypothetical protein
VPGTARIASAHAHARALQTYAEAGFEVTTTVTVTSAVIWLVTSCSSEAQLSFLSASFSFLEPADEGLCSSQRLLVFIMSITKSSFSVAQVVKKFITFCGTLGSINLFTRVHHLPLSRA